MPRGSLTELPGALPPDSGAEDRLNRAFAALADPLRRQLLARLAEGDATVNELAAPFAVTLQAVSKHLKVLQDAGLISRRRDAQRRPCHLEPTAFGPVAAWLEAYRTRAEEKYQRLDALLAAHEAEEGHQP